MSSWLRHTDTEKRIYAIGDHHAEHYRARLIDFLNSFQEQYPFDVLDTVQVYSARKSKNQDMDFSAVPEDIRASIDAGRYEYCLTLNAIADAYHVAMKATPLDCRDITQIAEYILEAFSCNESEDEFLTRELRHLNQVLHPDLTQPVPEACSA